MGKAKVVDGVKLSILVPAGDLKRLKIEAIQREMLESSIVLEALRLHWAQGVSATAEPVPLSVAPIPAQAEHLPTPPEPIPAAVVSAQAEPLPKSAPASEIPAKSKPGQSHRCHQGQARRRRSGAIPEGRRSCEGGEDHPAGTDEAGCTRYHGGQLPQLMGNIEVDPSQVCPGREGGPGWPEIADRKTRWRQSGLATLPLAMALAPHLARDRGRIRASSVPGGLDQELPQIGLVHPQPGQAPQVGRLGGPVVHRRRASARRRSSRALRLRWQASLISAPRRWKPRRDS